MNRHQPFRRTSLMLALLVAGPAFAQAPSLAPRPPPPPPPAAPDLAAAAPVASGRIAQFLINPNGDVDGLLLEDGTQVNFPPHLSASLTQLVRAGDRISVQGFRGYGAGAVHARVITNDASGQSLIDQPPAPGVPPPPPAALTALRDTAQVARLLYTDRGDVNGALLGDGMRVRFPPHIGAQLQASLRPGVQLAAAGYGTENAYGRALEATSLSVDGQAPLAVFGPGPR